MVLSNFLDENVFILQVVIVLTCFQSEKSQNKFDLMQSFLLKRLTKHVTIHLRGAKQKSHTSVILHSHFLLNLYQSTILCLVKTFRIKTFKKNIKIATKTCHNERIISSEFQPEVDLSLNITRRKVMITYGITKSYQFKFVDSLVLKLQDTETETCM